MFFEENNQGVLLRVRICPNSSCCRITGIFTSPEGGDFLKISVISVPEKGKANKELVSWLAKRLNIAKSDIQLVSGKFDKYKKIQLDGDKGNLLIMLKKMEQEAKNDGTID